MQDTFCLSVNSKFSFGATAGKEPGLQLLTSLTADMKSAEEGKIYLFKIELMLHPALKYLSAVLAAPLWI